MVKALAVSAALLGAAGCSKVTYLNSTTTPSGVVTEHTGRFFIGGLVGHADIWANQDCPHGVFKVLSRFSFVDIVLSLVTIDLYTPRTYTIECGA